VAFWLSPGKARQLHRSYVKRAAEAKQKWLETRDRDAFDRYFDLVDRALLLEAEMDEAAVREARFVREFGAEPRDWSYRPCDL